MNRTIDVRLGFTALAILFLCFVAPYPAAAVNQIETSPKKEKSDE